MERWEAGYNEKHWTIAGVHMKPPCRLGLARGARDLGLGRGIGGNMTDDKPNSKIKSCPFCFSLDVEVCNTRSLNPMHQKYVRCKGCYATGPIEQNDIRAVKYWNGAKRDAD